MDRAGAWVGRERELATLQEAWDRARLHSAGAFVLVTGEPGIGKTRLCEELADRVRAQASTVAWSMSRDSGAAPLQTWSQLLGGLPAGRVADPLSGRRDDLAAHRLQDDVVARLRDAASTGARLLIVDDLQWADPSSLRLAEHVAPALRSMAVLLVATYRDPPARTGDDGRGLRRLGHELRMPGLSLADVGQLLAEAGHDPSAPVVAALHDRTRGNPLFLSELVHLAERAGSLDEVASGAVPLPDTVSQAITARLHGLTAGTRDALAVASACGDEVRLDVLEHVLARSRTEVLDVIDAAVEWRLLDEAGSGRYRFTHPLVRAALYGSLGVARRLRVHQLIGRVVEQLRGDGHAIDAAVIAHHYGRAAAGGAAEPAVRWSRRAARASLHVTAYEDAVRHLRRAVQVLELSPAAGDPVEVLLELGEALIAAGDLPSARTTFLEAARRAREAGRTTDVARAALGVGSGGGFEIDLDDGAQRALLEEALGMVGDDAPTLRSMLSSRLSVASTHTAGIERRAELAEDAVVLARAGGSSLALAQALAARCDALAGPVDAEVRLADSAEITSIGKQVAGPRVELLGRRLRVVALLELGDLSGFERETEWYAATAASLAQPLYSWYVPLWRALRAALAGDLAGHRRWVDEAAALGDVAHSTNARLLTTGQRWVVHHELGEHDAEAEVLEQMLAHGLPLTDAEVGVAAALTRAVTGRVEQATKLLADATEDLRRQAPDSEWLAELTKVADAVAVLGGHAVAEWTYDALLPHRHRCAVDGIGLWWHGSVERHLGLLAAVLGRRGTAAAHFDAALTVNRASGSPLMVARTLRDAGVALADDTHLRAALVAYQDLHAGARSAELEQRLAGAPQRPTSSVPRLVREGDVWLFEYGGGSTRLRHTKGVADLALLLTRPGREVAALDLVGAGVEAPGSGDALDDRARSAYRRRVVEIEDELTGADQRGDPARSAALAAERDALVAQLAAAYGLGGRSRRAGSSSERARTAVTARLRDTIRRVTSAFPELGRHLDRTVRTGTFCVYDPDPPVRWEVRGSTSHRAP